MVVEREVCDVHLTGATELDYWRPENVPVTVQESQALHVPFVVTVNAVRKKVKHEYQNMKVLLKCINLYHKHIKKHITDENLKEKSK